MSQVKSIPIEQLEEHPLNSNRMSREMFEKLKFHIRRTGRYETIVVRRLTAEDRSQKSGDRGRKSKSPGRKAVSCSLSAKRYPLSATFYQILNGHHRVRALEELGHTSVRCDIWEVSDAEALLLLATLNRLEGKDDPKSRGQLIAAIGEVPAELAKKLPEPSAVLERLLSLASGVPEPRAPEEIAELDFGPLTFYLASCERQTVEEALRLAGEASAQGDAGANDSNPGRNDSRRVAPAGGGQALKFIRRRRTRLRLWKPKDVPGARPNKFGRGTQGYARRAGGTEGGKSRRGLSEVLASRTPSGSRSTKSNRSSALLRIAKWYLEAKGRL